MVLHCTDTKEKFNISNYSFHQFKENSHQAINTSARKIFLYFNFNTLTVNMFI